MTSGSYGSFIQPPPSPFRIRCCISSALYFLLFHLFVVFILHVEPDTIHFFKKHRYFPFPFRPVCIHLLYRMVFLFTDSLTQTLYYIPHTACADALAAGTAYDISGCSVGSFCYRHGKLLCQISRYQSDFIHLHCLVQQINICRFTIF